MTKLADEVIDERLDWSEGTAVPTVTQMEDIVLKLRQRLSARLAQAVMEAQAATRPVPGPLCPSCGRELHAQSMKQNTLESRVGQLPLERGYYYCETCRAGLFPPG